VIDNYCSKVVGDWTRLNFPQSWEKYKDNDTVELACKGASAEPLGRCNIHLILKKNDGSEACVLRDLTCTILDLGVDIIVGRPTILRERIARVLPDYFCSPTPPSEGRQLPDVPPVLRQTLDEVEQLTAPTLQPTEPAEERNRNTGKSLTCLPRALLPPGPSELGGEIEKKNHESESNHSKMEERSEISNDTDLTLASDVPVLAFVPCSAHAPGKPFLGSVDVKRVKHRSELMDITQESYGMIGEDSDLFPNAEGPISTEDILKAARIEGPESLQSAVRELITEYSDIFSNDVGQIPALVEPMKLSVDPKIWAV
jgi:hypothetical protein